MPRASHLALALSHDPDTGMSARERVRVLLADDNVTLRRSLRQLLDGEPDIEVIAEADELSVAAALIRRHRPDVIVLDVRLPSRSEADAVRQIRARAPDTRIVVITMHEAQVFAREAHDAGALGFVLKDTADDELPEAIRRAARDELYTSPRVVTRVIPLR
jgi:two-component system response regulator NreC